MPSHINCSEHVTADTACDLIISELIAADTEVTVLKLQKLLYYCQAWHLAFYKRSMFDGEFEAWVHGPVNTHIYKRFRSKSMYAAVSETDIAQVDSVSEFPEADRYHVKGVLEAYGHLTGTQLEQLTHQEQPWQDARGALGANQKCNATIDESIMASFYRSKL